jgi:hypothetical protein
MGDTTAMLYTNPPAHLAYWVRDTGEALGFLSKPAYAQGTGTGFVGLQPLLELWKVFRNIAYILLAIALIVLGFMIMFRRKIDPKTVVSIQNALPRVIMVMILITFSYAIAGILIDLMYVLIYVAASLLAPYLHAESSALFQQATGVQGIAQAFGSFNNLFAPLSMFHAEIPLSLAAIGAVVMGAPTAGAGAIPGAIIGFAFANIAALVSGTQGPGGLLSPILWVIFAIALLFTFFRIFFMLVTAYIQVLIAVIIGPLQILLDVFPNTNGFSSWLLGLTSNLLTFLLVSVLMLLMSVVINTIGTDNLWVPPFIGEVQGGLLKAIVGLGGMVLIPNLVSSMKKMLKVQPVIPLSAGSSFAPVGAAGGMALGTLQQFYYAKSIGGGALGAVRKFMGAKEESAGKGHGGHG